MKNLKELLMDREGYVILPSFIPRKLIADVKTRLKDLYPVRASSSKKVYAERDDIKNLEDVSVWWSQLVTDFPEVQSIYKLINPVISHPLPNMRLYGSDIVTIANKSEWISPHVDTPHRFSEWNFDKRLLGIQCIVAIDDHTKNGAATGLVPFSQKRDFEIDKCYTGAYDRWFMENMIQPEMPTGSVLLYNCRLLHSSMPNNKDVERPALLFNFLDKSIIEEVSKIDNVWSSNGKSP